MGKEEIGADIHRQPDVFRHLRLLVKPLQIEDTVWRSSLISYNSRAKTRLQLRVMELGKFHTNFGWNSRDFQFPSRKDRSIGDNIYFFHFFGFCFFGFSFF